MFWKIYFWLIALLLAYGAIASLSTWTGGPPLILIIAQLFNLLALVELYGYAYKKQFWAQWFWKLFLVIYILIPVLFLVYRAYLLRADNIGLMSLVGLIALIPSVPMYVGLYLYAFKNSTNKTKK